MGDKSGSVTQWVGGWGGERGTNVILWKRLKKRRGGNEKTRGKLVKGGI